MPVAASSLITLAKLEVYLGEEASKAITSGTALESQLEGLINSVSARFDAYVGRKLAKALYTAEKYNGPKGADLLLRNYPVVSITKLEEDDDELTEGRDDDYLLDAEMGVVTRVSGAWLRGPQVIEVTYTAGYVVQGGTVTAPDIALPADVQLACFIQVAAEWKKTQGSAWGVSSVSYPDGSISRFERGLLKEVVEMLEKYRRYSL